MHLAKYEGKWKIVNVLWQTHPDLMIDLRIWKGNKQQKSREQIMFNCLDNRRNFVSF